MRSRLLVFLLVGVTAHAGQTLPALNRIAGVNDMSGISYVLLSAKGKLVDANSDMNTTPLLTAQCTRTPPGKLRFELLADLGGTKELAYYPPWRSTSKDEVFPPVLDKTFVTMEFLGYTKVKPVKRQWEYLMEMPGEMRYATPGRTTSNLEEVTFYLRYLRSLPTLRLTVPGKGAAVWETSQWQSAVHAEPLCAASGL